MPPHVIVWVSTSASVPSFFLNVTVAVHFAYKFQSFPIEVISVHGVPVKASASYHPANVTPDLDGVGRG